MRRTLFLIPHEIAGLPVFGVGWILIALVIGFAVRLVIGARRGGPARAGSAPGQTLGSILAAEGPFWALAAAAVVFLLPAIELQNVAGEPVGLAIRGYGVMLLLGVGSAVALAAYRAKTHGLKPEVIYAMAPWSFIGGIVGARLFYVIQYRHTFYADTFLQTAQNMLKFTEGGLVVYGAFIGGFIGSAYFVWRHKLPLLKLGDVIVPCLFLGVFFGRIGCLMNGCCYGGRCEAGPTAIHFPAGSPVYHDQLLSGTLIGIQGTVLDQGPGRSSVRVEAIRPGSLMDRADVEASGQVARLAIDPSYLRGAPRDVPVEQAGRGLAVSIDGRVLRWSPEELPDRALPVQAAQLISSGSALLLTLLLLGLSPRIRRTGVLMFVGFAGYAILRFVLEWVRVDEAGQFGTALSISQWVSIAVLTVSLCGLGWLFSQSAGTGSSGPSSHPA